MNDCCSTKDDLSDRGLALWAMNKAVNINQGNGITDDDLFDLAKRFYDFVKSRSGA